MVGLQYSICLLVCLSQSGLLQLVIAYLLPKSAWYPTKTITVFFFFFFSFFFFFFFSFSFFFFLTGHSSFLSSLFLCTLASSFSLWFFFDFFLLYSRFIFPHYIDAPHSNSVLNYGLIQCPCSLIEYPTLGNVAQQYTSALTLSDLLNSQQAKAMNKTIYFFTELLTQ